MLNALKELAKSKKVFLTLLSISVWVLGRFGLHASTETLLPVVGPIWALVFGIAGADWGKEAAAINAAAAPAQVLAPVTVVAKAAAAPKLAK